MTATRRITWEKKKRKMMMKITKMRSRTKKKVKISYYLYCSIHFSAKYIFDIICHFLHSVQKYPLFEERKENMKMEENQEIRTLKMDAKFWYC